MLLSVIVAVADNGVIGRDNALPWHISEDLKYFKRITLGKPIIMGRKTFDSIGRPLPGRANIVVTRNSDYAAEGVHVASSLDDALALAADIALIDGVEEALVIGGAQIYEEAIPRADRLYLTEVHAEVAGDAFLSPIETGEWREVSREERVAEPPNPFNYSFVVYERGAP